MSNRNGGNEMDVDKNVEFLYKAMMQRDPKKRQVKLVKPHLMQIDFGSLEDSSDDSDFKLNSDAEDDDDDIDDEDDDDNNNNPNATKSDNDDDNDDEDVEEEDGDDGDEEKNKTDQKLKEKRKSDDESANKENAKKRKLNEEGEAADDDKQSDNEDKQSSAAKSDQQQDEDDDASGKNIFKRIVVPVCSVCLGDSNNSSNEIVECDNCHETVHEGCFGVSDSHSTSSSDSSSSMEPWFCDACKAGVKPHCELCPNLGGIFKETDSGRWVHLICALYTKGIAFGDVEKLSNITLFEMPYSKWGAKECSFCEDPRFSRTGVCISCDAGMCRVHFHVTCAQRQGLLTEASPEEANVIADPYFAYCKIHADKLSMRHNHRNWLALQSNLKSDERDRGISEADKIRLQRKLGNHQMKYQEAKCNRQPCWVPKEKMPRMLLSNSYALKQLLRKAELQGVNEDVSAKDTRKRGYIPPAFSVDFVSYYLERNELMENMKGRYKEMRQQSMEMRKTEKQISQRIEELKKEIQSLSSSSMQTQRTGLTLWDFMMNIAGRRIRIPECVSFRNFARSPTKSDVDQSSTSKQLLKCAVCKLSRDQHLLANCDRCQGSYHLDCLDPPLTRMPKKTKSQGWQCSYCSKDQVEAEVEKPAEGLDKPRRLREKRLIREPLKYTTQFAHENRIRCQKDKKAKKRSNPVPSNHSYTSEANLKKAGSLPLPTSEKPKPGNSAQTPVEAATDSPLSISSGEEEEDEDEEEERSDNKPSSDDASSLDDKPQPMEVVQVREGSPRGQSPTNQLQPVKVLLKEATSSLDPMLVTNGKQGGNVITIFKASPQSAVNQLSKSPVKRVILTKVNCLDPSALPQASLNVSPQLVSSSSAVRVVPVPSEKKLPIIIRRKQPLLPEVPRTVMAVRQLTNPVAPTVSKPDEFIEISDDDDECKQ